MSVWVSVLIVCFYQLVFFSVSGNDITAQWVENFPSTMKKVQDQIIGENIQFTDYITSHKCHSLYDFKDCIERIGSKTTSKKSVHVEFPNHPIASHRQSCIRQIGL